MPTFDIKQTQEIADHVEHQLEEATHRGLLSAGMRLIGVIQNELIPGAQPPPPPILNRHYTSAWQIEDVSSKEVHVKNTMPYAAVIERGARPENVKIGRLMIDALTEWVITKGMVGRPKSPNAKAVATIEARQIAWAIAKSMQTKGIFIRNGQEGLRIAEKAAKRAPELVAKEVAREIKKLS
jgi:hypothetical protein